MTGLQGLLRRESAMAVKEIFAKYRTGLITLCSAAVVITAIPAAHAAENVTVYKLAACGCCAIWSRYMGQAGFDVEVVNVGDLTLINEQFGIPQNVAACHTAKLGDYYIVGHIPAPDIRKFLDEKPDVIGISVPGMPPGSPGMTMGGRAVAYDSVLFTSNGETTVYVSHSPND